MREELREQDIPEYCYDNRTKEPVTYSRKYSEDLVGCIREKDYEGVMKNYNLFRNNIEILKEKEIDYDKRLENLIEKIYLDFVNERD